MDEQDTSPEAAAAAAEAERIAAEKAAAAAAEVAAPKPKRPYVRRQKVEVVTDVVTDQKTTRDVLTDEDVEALPASVKVAAPYAFYDDNGKLHSWAAGQVLDDAEEIAILVDRGVIFEAD